MAFGQKINRLLRPLIVETNAIRYFSSLRRTELWSVERLTELQTNRLRELFEHVYHNVPYYRQVFRARSLKAYDFRSFQDLVKLPIMTREIVKQHFGEFVSINSQKYGPIATATGGSTGEPLRFFIDDRSASIGEAALWRGWSYAGYRFGDKIAVLAGLSLIPTKENLLKAASKRVVRRTAGFPVLSLREEDLSLYAKHIAAFKPKFIRGYPSSIYYFAGFLKDNGIDTIHPQAVLTTAEMLFPFQRKLIEEVLQCDVFDGYGAFDGGTAAFECDEHNGYHMAVEKAIIEFVDEAGNPVSEGEEGRIVATDLFNYAMPFIRYDTGDMGVYSTEECRCGRKLTLIKKILGRTTDILRFRNGTVLSGPSLTLVFKDFDIKQYQIHQTSDDSIVVKIVRGKTYSERDNRNIYRVLKNAVGDAVKVRLESVDYIQAARSGKWRIVISDLKKTEADNLRS